jgi:hypothetical protein
VGKQKLSIDAKVMDTKAYETVCGAFKARKTGITTADLAAQTGLPLAVVKEAATRASDEYGARLSVTESGEVLYQFPHGFKSRYRGAGAAAKRVLRALGKGLFAASKVLFKVWIMLMLVGYFVFFMGLALFALVLSMAANSSNNSSSSRSNNSVNLVGGLFNMIIRLWFYSELFNIDRNAYRRGGRPARPRAKPLHRAIFSFVFGDGDPNADIERREKMALAAYIQANNGVINLEEYIAFTGKPPASADREITAFCAEFGGSPEAAEDGVIVYRFDELLLKAETHDAAIPYKKPRPFSLNPRKMNVTFALINAVNLLFGGYFLYNALFAAELNQFTYLYALTAHLFSSIIVNPPLFIFAVLGVVPAVFSALFWLIPALRGASLKKENKAIERENNRKNSMKRIYENPLSVKSASGDDESFIKELSFFRTPDVTQTEDGTFNFSFDEIMRDKQSTEKYRTVIQKETLGRVVFDTGLVK